jgi:two-component system response regulator PilR (NtrC family)
MPGVPIGSLRAARLLIVDDDVEMRSWLADALSRAGAITQQAASGWESLTLLAERHYDLVISDVRMPPPNGLCVLSSARAVGVATPFILISGFGDDCLRDNVERIEGAAMLDKPFAIEDLVTIAEMLIWRDLH